MKIYLLVSPILLILFGCSSNSNTKAEQPIEPIVQVTPDQFHTIMDATENYILLDVRTPEEIQQGKIEDALEMDFRGKDFEASITQLDPNKAVLVYCASGNRSMKTARLLKQKGFPKIYNLDGGYQAWLKYNQKQ